MRSGRQSGVRRATLVILRLLLMALTLTMMGTAGTVLTEQVPWLINTAEAESQGQPGVQVNAADAASAESSPAPGILALTVPVGTAVLIDGKQVGTVGTGSLEVQLEPGAHKIRLELPGFAPHEEVVAITSSQRLERTFELSPLVPAGRGLLYLRSRPEPVTGQLVSIDPSGVRLVTSRGVEAFPADSLAFFTPVEAPSLSGNIPAGVTITRAGELISGLPVAYDAASGVLTLEETGAPREPGDTRTPAEGRVPGGRRLQLADVAAIIWHGRRLEVANRPPVVILFEVPQEVVAGGTAPFRAEAQDPEGDELRYVWTFSQGKPDTAASQTVTWIAPLSQVGLQVDVTLLVADADHEVRLFSLVNVLPPDADQDGLSDAAERHLRTRVNNPDTDEDRVTDGEEVALGTNPLDVDTDDDGVMDGVEVEFRLDPLRSDTDGDGLTDGDEIGRGTNPLRSDSDDDTLSDGDEVRLGTNPLSQDSDGDGLADNKEIELKTDPRKGDTDNDGLIDGYEVSIKGTSPLIWDTDGDGFSDDGDLVPLKDAVLELEIKWFQLHDDTEPGYRVLLIFYEDPDDTAEVYLLAWVNSDMRYVPTWRFPVFGTHPLTPGQSWAVYQTRRINVPDNQRYVKITIAAYDEDSSGKYDVIDIDGSDKTSDLTLYYDIVSQTWSGDDSSGDTDGRDDGYDEYDGSLWYDIRLSD